MKSDANARLLAYTDILGDEGIPDMNSFFYMTAVNREEGIPDYAEPVED